MTKYIFKTSFVLLIICAVCSVLCAAVKMFTAPRILQNQIEANHKAAQAVSGGMIPGMETSTTDIDNFDHERWGDAINSVTPLYVKNANLVTDPKSGDALSGDIGGYLLNLTGTGYGGDFTLIASYRLDGSLISAKMTDNSETAGLGKKAENEWYMDQFKDKGGEIPLPQSKDELDDPSLVSGASVTFNGVTSALRLGSEYVKEMAR